MPNARTARDLQGAIAQLQFADLFRQPQTIAESGAVRIDVQSQWTGPDRQRMGSQLQAQVGSRGAVSAIRLADSLGEASGAANQLAVLQTVQLALAAGAGDGLWREVTGRQP